MMKAEAMLGGGSRSVRERAYGSHALGHVRCRTDRRAADGNNRRSSVAPASGPMRGRAAEQNEL